MKISFHKHPWLSRSFFWRSVVTFVFRDSESLSFGAGKPWPSIPFSSLCLLLTGRYHRDLFHFSIGSAHSIMLLWGFLTAFGIIKVSWSLTQKLPVLSSKHQIQVSKVTNFPWIVIQNTQGQPHRGISFNSEPSHFTLISFANTMEPCGYCHPHFRGKVWETDS